MRILSTGRGNGKTEGLITMSLVYGTPIIVATESEKGDILKKFPNVEVYTASGYAEYGLRGGGKSEDVLVDNIDRVLSALLHQEVIFGTITER